MLKGDLHEDSHIIEKVSGIIYYIVFPEGMTNQMKESAILFYDELNRDRDHG